jgi:DNA-binding NtrC family response regulator
MKKTSAKTSPAKALARIVRIEPLWLMEKKAIQRAMGKLAGNKTAAKLLGIGVTTLYRKLKLYNVKAPRLTNRSRGMHPKSRKASLKALAIHANIEPLWLMEKKAILHAMAKLAGDKTIVAYLLGIGRTALYRKLKLYQSKSSRTQRSRGLHPTKWRQRSRRTLHPRRRPA